MIKTTYNIFLLICFLSIFLTPGGEAAVKKGLEGSVKQGYQAITEATFQQILKDYLCSRLKKEKSDIIVSRLKVSGNRPVPTGKVSFQSYQKEKRRLEAW